LPDWLIWKWPSLDNQWNEPLYNVFLGLGVGFILYVIGMLDFVRRDVK
ncbi:MAG TPA: permease, partial [Candidatus Avamphibacillus sp.]|nr:permease [Candidatus Avamphibacillus sp.]